MTTTTTTSTNAILATLRDAILGSGGGSVGAILGTGNNAKLYQDRAPDETQFPYAVMRLMSSNDGRLHGLRVDATLEIQIHARPSAQTEVVNDLADLIDRALTFYIMHEAAGLMICTGKNRLPLPRGGAPIDSETATMQITYALVIWPKYLTTLVG